MRSIFLVILLSALPALAGDFGVEIGAASDSANSNTSGYNISSGTGLQGGALGYIDINEMFRVRTGFIYTQRNFSVPNGTVSFTYADVPVGVLWQMSDFGGPFIGANLAFNVAASCPNVCSGVQNIPVGYQFGVDFKWAPLLGTALYYEGMGPLGNQIDQPKAIVVQMQIRF